MDRINIAGMSLGGGRKDKFFFCLLEYYSDSERWFLKSVLQVKDEDAEDGDDAIRKWATDFNLKDLVVDFPLTTPPCHDCELDCPGMKICPAEEVRDVRERMQVLLDTDKEIFEHHPKSYEKDRQEASEIRPSFNVLEKKPDNHILSKSFKRRLRKGFLPYWNRPIDVWVWENYYDHLLHFFNAGFDSFGNASTMLMSRFAYLRRHLPEGLSYYETSTYICLIELLRSKIITKSMITNLKDIDQGVNARALICKAIEEHLGIFIYEHDMNLICKNPKAFDSFLLAVTGHRVVLNEVSVLPRWCKGDGQSFAVPKF